MLFIIVNYRHVHTLYKVLIQHSGCLLRGDFAVKLIEEAESDLASARTQLKESRFHKSVFDAQQCVEKMMKAVLALEGLTQVYDDDPSGLFASEIMTRADNDFLEELREVIRESDWLMDQYPFVRYARLRSRQVISPLDRYERTDAEEAVKIAEKATRSIKNFAQQQYQLKI